jgi:hypothetical protein
MNRLIIALCLIAGCGGTSPDFVDKHGVEFYLHIDNWKSDVITQPEAEIIEDYMINRLSTDPRLNGQFPQKQMENCLRCGVGPLEVRIRNGMFDCQNPQRQAVEADEPYGACIGNQLENTINLTDNIFWMCGYWVPYGHELIHFFQECVLGKEDYDHTMPYVWAMGDDATNIPCERVREGYSPQSL